jgi:hypothetical protein
VSLAHATRYTLGDGGFPPECLPGADRSDTLRTHRRGRPRGSPPPGAGT